MNNLESDLESFEAIGAQGVHIGDAVAFVEFGEVVILVFEVDIAHLGDLEGVFAGIGPFFEEFPHLVGAFEIELLDIVFEAIGIADGFARLDGEDKSVRRLRGPCSGRRWWRLARVEAHGRSGRAWD